MRLWHRNHYLPLATKFGKEIAPDSAVDAPLREALNQFGAFGQQCARGAVTKGPQLLGAGKKASDRFAAALKPCGLKP